MEQNLEIARLVLEFIEVLIWPLTLFVLACMFEREAVDLVNRVVKWNGPGFSAEFSKTAEKVEDQTEDAIESHTHPVPDPPGVGIVLNAELKKAGLRAIPGAFDFDRYRTLSLSDPNLALAGLRIDLEIMLQNLAKSFELENTHARSAGKWVRDLQKAGALRTVEVKALDSLLYACNRAVHGEEVTPDAANKIIDSGEALINFLGDTAMSKIYQQ